jgi:hypothetical protein
MRKDKIGKVNQTIINCFNIIQSPFYIDSLFVLVNDELDNVHIEVEALHKRLLNLRGRKYVSFTRKETKHGILISK